MGEVTGNVTDVLSKLNPNQFNNSVALDRYFANWEFRRLEETDNVYKSGILSQANQDEQALLAPGRGYAIQIPHVTAIDVTKRPTRLGTDTDIHGDSDGNTFPTYEVKALETKSYDFSIVDKYLTGVDQQTNVLNQMTAYWGHQDEARLIHMLNATFANKQIANAKGYHLGNSNLDNPGAKAQPQLLKPSDFMMANTRMGDNNLGTMNKVAMNSAVYWYMRSQDTFNNYIDKPSASTGPLSTYEGFQIVPDDSIPINPDGTTALYIFGGGAVHFVTEPFPGDGVSITTDHNKQGGVIQFTQKRVVCGHVDGTCADLDTAHQNGFSEYNWDQALWSDAPIYKPIDNEALRDLKIIKMGVKLPSEAVVTGVNVPDSTGVLGDDGAGQNNSSNTSKK